MAERALVLTCPRGTDDGEINLPIASVLRAEARQAEVALVNKLTAPELLTAMNRAWLDVSQMAIAVTSHLNAAQKRVDKRKAIILLDEVPKLMEQKGIAKANEDVRQAALTLDEEYQLLVDRTQRIEAVLELLKLKARAFENAFTSVKRILGSSALTDRPAGTLHVTPDGIEPAFGGGFGKPKT